MLLASINQSSINIGNKMITVDLDKVASQLRLFNKEQGKPCSFSLDDKSVIFENYEINVTASWLCQLGLYNLITMKDTEITKLIKEKWIENNVVRHNHLICISNKTDLTAINKIKGAKATITSNGNIRIILSSASGKTAITECNVALSNLGYGKAIYSLDAECYISKTK